MKAGDLVRLIGSFPEGERICTIITLNEFSEGWHSLLWRDRQIVWPELQMEIISESR